MSTVPSIRLTTKIRISWNRTVSTASYTLRNINHCVIWTDTSHFWHYSCVSPTSWGLAWNCHIACSVSRARSINKTWRTQDRFQLRTYKSRFVWNLNIRYLFILAWTFLLTSTEYKRNLSILRLNLIFKCFKMEAIF